MSTINLAIQAVQHTIAPATAAIRRSTSGGAAMFPRPSIAPAAPGSQPPAKPPENALTSLTKYIPTEILTLFVGTVSAKPALQQLQAQWHTHFRMVHVYIAFIIFTSLFFLLVYLAGIKRSGRPIPPFLTWPWFMTFASAIAFAVWALSVPGTGLVPVAAAAAMGVVALLVSVLFTHLEAIFS